MISSEQVEQLRVLIDQAQSIFVMFGDTASVDHVAVAIALQQTLRDAGKDVVLIAPSKPTSPQLSMLIGIDQVTTEMGNQNLSVSFPYVEAAVDKVSYHIGEETSRFYLTIKPKKGVQPLDSSQVEFSYTGADADLLLLVGVAQLSALKDVYVGYEELYTSKPVVTVHGFSPDFGTLHLDTSGTPTISESIVPVLKNLGLEISSDVATNLFTAIESLSKGFQSLSTTADTFETVAQLLRMGARRMRTTTAEVALSEQQEQHISEANSDKKQTSEDQTGRPRSKKKQTVLSNSSSDSKQQPGSLNYQPTEGVGRS